MAIVPSKPPLSLPRVAPKVPPTATIPPKGAEATPRPAPSVSEREDLGGGDFLIGTMENEAKNHKVQLIERTDSSQFIRFYMKCSCGTEGRFHLEAQVRNFAEYHLQRHPR